MMGDQPTNGTRPLRRQLSDGLVDQLRRALATYGSAEGGEADISSALRAIGAEARASGVKAEQLVASLKRVFDSLTPPPTLASQEARAKRLAHLVTVCVREYYAPSDEAASTDPLPTS
jgi:hypothetical protein